MGLGEILAAMNAQAAKEEQGLLDGAKAEAAAVWQAARARAEQTRSRHSAEARAAAAAARSRLQSESQLEAEALRQRAREVLVAEAFRVAEQRLRAARARVDYPLVLQALFAEAFGQFPSQEPVEIECDPLDLTLVRDLAMATGRQATVQGALQSAGGLRLLALEGRVVVDNTLEARLRRARELLWPVVAEAVVEALDEQHLADEGVPGMRERHTRLRRAKETADV